MEDNIVNTVTDLYRDGKWEEIIENYHDHPDRNRLCWVFPSVENLLFIQKCLEEIGSAEIISIGCGSGFLEWIIMQGTGIPVSGIEVEGTWWRCKYAPPSFIPILLTRPKLEKDVISILQNSGCTLLFCYFNNRPAFQEYLKYFSGSMLIIIGPDGKNVHTDPKPFDDIGAEWKLYKWQEVRHSKDFIAIYCKTKNINIFQISKQTFNYSIILQ